MTVINQISQKKCMTCHYWYFLDLDYKYEPEMCNWCHDISMMDYELENFVMPNVKGFDYRCAICNVTRNDAINIFNNPKLDHKDSLWIWILVQIKHQ